MVNPSSGDIGTAASELLKELQQVQTALQDADSQPVIEGTGNTFQDTLQAHQAPTHAPQSPHLKPLSLKPTTGNVLLHAQQISSTQVGATAKAQRSQVSNMIESLVKGQDKMSQLMKVALSGRKFSHQELLAMQAVVYQFSQEVELTSKVVEKATSGVKQTMNTQV